MNEVKFGDCRATMRQWSSDGVKVQSCVTSPPYYGLRDYGHEAQIGLEQTPEEYISIWSVATKPYSGAHFAVFPQDLIEPCILAGSRVDDIVLDPFMGSGTTALVAHKNGRKYLGCELNTNYKQLQDERFDSLFDELWM